MNAPTDRIDFAAVNAAALGAAPTLLRRWLPDGHQRGDEWIAKNPKRADRHAGSFRVNMRSGKWSDFAMTGVGGGDLISLAAYLTDRSQIDAARALAKALGINQRLRAPAILIPCPLRPPRSRCHCRNGDRFCRSLPTRPRP